LSINTYRNQTRQAKKSAQKNLLVVDDYPEMRDIIRVMLRDNGYSNVLTADCGNRALRTMESRPVSIVITDWTMPNMTGIELLTHIKSDPKWFTIPVVMISDERDSAKVLYAAEEGVDGFLVKPFSELDLINSIKAALAKCNLKDEIEKKIVEMRRLKLSNNYQEALKVGSEILAIRNHPRVLLMTCECLFKLKQYDKALSIMADVDEEDRTSQHAQLIGQIHINAGRYAQGILALEKAVNMNALNNDLKIDLAVACFANEDIEEAERVIQSVMNNRPTDLNMVNIAKIYLDRGDTDKAGAYLKQTVDPIKETVQVFNKYAVALRKVDRFEDAAEIYRKCLKIEPESDVLHYNLAVLYTKTHQPEEAKKSLTEALRINPENEYASSLISRLR
jgi:two-component system, chemotaxis family, chemotaxis protein CheY